MNCIVLDYRVRESIVKYFENEGLNIVLSYKNHNLIDAVNGHVDLNLIKIGNKIISSPESYEYYEEKLKPYLGKNEIIKGENYLFKEYPLDIRYNVALVGKNAIAMEKYIDKKILIYLKNEGYKIIDVKQGYSRCNICIVDEKSIITSDKGIYNALRKENIDVLLIESGNIDLFELNYGFIGGASGNIFNRIYFFGDVKGHPDYLKINEFIRERGREIVSIDKEKLTDYGSFIIF